MIYFIHAPISGKIKIGYTDKDIKHRFSNLQVGSPEKLFVLGLIYGKLENEKYYHSQFLRSHSHGEWFSDSILTEVLAIIRLKCYWQLSDYSGIQWSDKFNFIEYAIRKKEQEEKFDQEYFIWNGINL